MKIQFSLVVLLCLFSWTVSSEIDPEKRYTILGKYVVIDEDPLPATGMEVSNNQKSSRDLSSATIVVSVNIAEDGEEPLFLEISRSDISNGKVVLEGELDEPTLAKISVESEGDPNLRALTLLVPGQTRSIALLNHRARPELDRLVMVRALDLAKDLNKKFLIVGDLTGIDEERYPMPMISIHLSKFDEKGNRKSVEIGPVQAKNNSFSITGEVAEPRAVKISVISNSGLSWGSTEAIVEPNALISVVVSSRWARQLAATAGAGKHAEVIGKWRMGERYLLTETNLDKEFEKLRTGTGDSKEESADGNSIEEQRASAYVRAHSDKNTKADVGRRETVDLLPANGCEHLVIQADPVSDTSIQEDIAPREKSQGEILFQRLHEIRNAALLDIVENAEDPFNSVLALELDPFVVLGAHSPSSAALPYYDNLMTLLEDDIVAKRVKPARDALAQSVARETSMKRMIRGQLAPSFELPTLSGELISLENVLEEADYVYIDFWASWCHPCIEAFPVLKDTYSTYRDKGFEVVSISVDDLHTEWKDAADNIDFPWTDLGSIGGILTKTPLSYGVVHLPTGILVDSKGCIIEKDISTTELKKALESNLGKSPANE